jgi:hypothetical protein
MLSVRVCLVCVMRRRADCGALVRVGVAEAGGEMTAAPSAKAPRRRKAKPTGKAK